MKYLRGYSPLNETGGYPDPIKIWSDLIYEQCLTGYQTWLGWQGKFAHYQDQYHLTYEAYEDQIPGAEFLKFPVERMDITFNIIVSNEYDSPSYSGSFADLKKNKRNPQQSHWIKSHSGLVERAVVVKIFVDLYVPREAKSWPVDWGKKTLRTVINHELIHAYQFIHNTDANAQNAWYFAINTAKKKCMQRYDFDAYQDFFYCLYISAPCEVNAFSGQALYKVGPYQESLTMGQIKALETFDAEETYAAFKQELAKVHPRAVKYSELTDGRKVKRRQTGLDFLRDEQENRFEPVGAEISKYYHQACRRMGIEPAPWVRKLAGLDFLAVMRWFEPTFKRAAQTMRHKGERPTDSPAV